MKHVTLLLGMVVLVSSCAQMREKPATPAQVVPRLGPVGDPGSVIKIKMQNDPNNHKRCPVSAIDYSSFNDNNPNANIVAACQIGTVIKSAAACRPSSTHDQPVVVKWEARGNPNDEFKIEFKRDNHGVTVSPFLNSADPTCNSNSGSYQCTGTMQENLTKGTEYQYQVTNGDDCPALDPYIISF